MEFSIILFITFLISGSYSYSVLDNVTVSSDILNELFYQEIENNLDLLRISSARDDTTNSYDSEKCIHSLSEIKRQFPSTKVLPFIDSWGKLPSGILHGNLYTVGNFDQCVQTSVTLTESSGLVEGQYCFLRVPLKNQKPQNDEMPIFLDAPILEGRASLSSAKINIGICIPNSCSPEVVTPIFETAVRKAFNGALSGVSVLKCTNGKIPPLKTINIVGIVIFSIFGLLMILSSLYEFFMKYFKREPVPVLLAFSVLTNGRKMFAINTKRSPNTIDCLTGIRVFSMVWVVYCHTYLISRAIPEINGLDKSEWFRSLISMPVVNGTVSVDSFFFISGLLVAWIGFRELDKTNGKLNIIMMYVHRYIRLTPVVASGLLFIFSLNEIIGTGPFRQSTINSEKCKGDWWGILLYMQNYFFKSKCYGRTWYLAIDFQLYILSPLILIPMWKWGKKFAPVLVALALMSIGCVMTVYITSGFTDLRGFSNTDEWSKTYTPMHTRCSPWLVGFGLGYYMHINRNRTFRISKLVQMLGWIACFGIFLAVLFGPYDTIRHHAGQGTVFETAMYEAWKRVSWSIALAWLTFACHFGFGGIIDSILSHPFWQPLGRLTYSLYLYHMFVFRINFGTMRTSMFFSTYNEFLYFWSGLGVSLMVAIVISLAFESPVLVLEKFIFGNGNSKKKQQHIEPTTSPKVIVEIPTKDQ
ncbi:nose resistant to fluoxetine protein 6-like [Eupeodes corollae]|uniref:nose resistant to fluoxetine protein 6-like n=1 Tax=Eupeodes corollae TaxID=290404 RepID=UPI00249374D4|nr:nose resistant to fluoxetine protein 6-like [Eupeodes corollae]